MSVDKAVTLVLKFIFIVTVSEGTLLGRVESYKSGFDDDQKQHMILSAATDNGIQITGVCSV